MAGVWDGQHLRAGPFLLFGDPALLALIADVLGVPAPGPPP